MSDYTDPGLAIKALASNVKGKMVSKIDRPIVASEGDQLVYTAGMWKGGKAAGESNLALGIAAAPTGGDDTAAIHEAIEHSLYLRPTTPNVHYSYHGNGWGSGNETVDKFKKPVLRGPGSYACTIDINTGNSTYLIDTNIEMWASLFQGFTVYGGAGLLRHRWTGPNVYMGRHLIHDVNVFDFHECAVQWNASDMPAREITDCLINGADETVTGIAMSGLTDMCSIRRVSFGRRKIAIHLAPEAANMVIEQCDFGRLTMSPAGRIDIWLTPRDSNNMASHGVTIRANKFGSENYNGDYRILVADQSSGGMFGTKTPTLAASTGWCSGVNVINNQVNGSAAAPTKPLVYSYTGKTCSWNISGNRYGGTLPQYVLEYAAGTSKPQFEVNAAGQNGTVIGPELMNYANDTIIGSNQPTWVAYQSVNGVVK